MTKNKLQHQRQQQIAHKYSCVINSCVGKLGIIIANNQIAKIVYLSTKARLISPKNLVTRQIVSKIKKYFCNPRLQFKLVMNLSGTVLQIKIWKALQKIPCGKTITYGELAQKIGTSPRVIGNACRRNPIPIIIPCHRVVAANGLGGYCGNVNSGAIKIKEWLLKHESDYKL
ncbi:MAG: hypothetical protein ACD_69C00203G0002 [uncultured bacterium]|nr:MAG: hypothetical protein ACD_69C00203G0002 [uncultured bacterium]OGT08803.1 MAG: hypothetical protein A2V89_02030 [Gammaproteobacteria bacterium RBG_16_37_9]HBC72154.1 hypothetical protein [Coxiellaceae bacterium]HBY56033.1 hypothetical protein [Coxiellaceae bacterium]